MVAQGATFDFGDDDIIAFAERMKHEVIAFLDDMVSRVRKTTADELNEPM